MMLACARPWALLVLAGVRMPSLLLVSRLFRIRLTSNDKK